MSRLKVCADTDCPPNSCIPNRAKTTMKRKRRNSKLTMDFIELRSETTRFRRGAQYLKMRKTNVQSEKDRLSNKDKRSNKSKFRHECKYGNEKQHFSSSWVLLIKPGRWKILLFLEILYLKKSEMTFLKYSKFCFACHLFFPLTSYIW